MAAISCQCDTDDEDADERRCGDHDGAGSGRICSQRHDQGGSDTPERDGGPDRDRCDHLRVHTPQQQEEHADRNGDGVSDRQLRGIDLVPGELDGGFEAGTERGEGGEDAVVAVSPDEGPVAATGQTGPHGSRK